MEGSALGKPESAHNEPRSRFPQASILLGGFDGEERPGET